MENNPSYIEDLIKDGSKSDSEDRLSSIFSATFNHSEIFRELFIVYNSE